MSGRRTTKNKLNRTLLKVCDVLNENNINDWFIFFGTLLGIVREDGCIKGDDDLDIMINCDCQKLRLIFEKAGFTFTSDSDIKNLDTILKTKPCRKYASFDFYMCQVQGKNYFTTWQNVEVQNVEIETKAWKSTHINLPKNAETILEKLYGGTWRTPAKKSKIRKQCEIYDRSIKTII